MKMQINFSKLWQWLKSIPVQTILIAVFILILVFQKECTRFATDINNGTGVKTDTVFITEKIYDSVPKYIDHYYPLPNDTIILTVPAMVDTNAILADYFSKIYYVDTILNDTSGLIVIRDTISKNRIISRSGEFKNRRPTIINTTTIINKYPSWNIGIGLFVGGNFGEFQAGPSLLITINKKSSYLAEFDIMHKTFRVGMFWNVR